ncbi:glutamine amidotransferase subunit PdxT [Fructobacillus ficulneus]|uniref:Glutamine amidotransferase subunit PdxT n=1 Tax=Fructobacillus ficulneus TaxID=157463 RepID=A0A0K8MIR8_9LACO|nr:glutamine amidotransferase subunit PdxT [Fructobacillus ficulneus]
MPVFGTCAGLVLLSKTDVLAGLEGDVERNGFGRQRDSFEAGIAVAGLDQNFPGIFIRAPYLKSVGDDVEVLAKIDDDRIIAAKRGNVLVTAFHPELSDDTRMHQMFLDMVKA